MRSTLILSVIFGLAVSPVLSEQISPDAILGTYLNPDGTRTVKIYNENDRYFGVIATAPKQPDGNEGVGFIVFRDFVFDPDTNTWKDGRLDSPMRPRINVSGRLALNENGDLIVRGRGVAALAGATIFPRVD